LEGIISGCRRENGFGGRKEVVGRSGCWDVDKKTWS